MNKTAIKSPNNWLIKAGAYVDGTSLVLPHHFLLVSMGQASRAVERYTINKNNTDLSYRINDAISIALCVRSAEEAFFKNLYNEVPKNWNKKLFCYKCLRNNGDLIFGTKLKKYRKKCNNKIIHVMENHTMPDPKDLEYAINYYEEIFNLPLMPGEINFGKKLELKLCDECSNKFG